VPEGHDERTMTDEQILAKCEVCDVLMLDAEHRAVGVMPAEFKVLRMTQRCSQADLSRLEELWNTRREELWPGTNACFLLKPNVTFLQFLPVTTGLSVTAAR